MNRLALLLLLLLSWGAVQAQPDSLKDNRYAMRATLYGAGFTHELDTYLSPVSYTGPEFRVMRESMRTTNLMKGNVSTQSLFQVNFSITENKASTSTQMAGMLNWNYAWHYQFRMSDRLKLLFGPMIDMNGGFVYNMRNSNNLAQARAYINLAASGMAIYRFRIGNYPMVARYQLNLPLMGVMFSPEYGQSYFEIFELKHKGNNFVFSSLHNQPSLRQMLTLDFPVGKINLRAAYLCDIQQAKVNHLKNHSWSHIFMLGLVKNFCIIRGKNKVAMPSHLSPY